jgi:DNA-binding response OmpR family regulator
MCRVLLCLAVEFTGQEPAVADRIVIGDADRMSVNVMRYLLEDEGYSVDTATRASDVLSAVIGAETALVILDVDLPDSSGFDLLQALRARRYRGPCLVVTRRGSTPDIVRGFDIGADDYLVKPFEPAELSARVHSLIRRFQQTDTMSQGTVIQVGDAELSLGTLTYRSRSVDPTLLTPTEMRLLEVLMRNDRQVISRERLVERVWGDDFAVDTNRIDVYVRRIRNKIEPERDRLRYLHTVRGLGYVFRADDVADGEHATDG